MDPEMLTMLREMTRELWREWLGSVAHGRWCWHCRYCGRMVWCDDTRGRTTRRRRRKADGHWHSQGCVVAWAFRFLKRHGERPQVTVWDDPATRGVDKRAVL